MALARLTSPTILDAHSGINISLLSGSALRTILCSSRTGQLTIRNDLSRIEAAWFALPAGEAPRNDSLCRSFEFRKSAAPVFLALEFDDIRLLDEWQAQCLPNIDERFDEFRNMSVGVQRARRDTKPFAAFGDRRIIDRLNIDAVAFEQHVACSLTLFGVADEDRNDMRRIGHNGQARGAQRMFGQHRFALVLPEAVCPRLRRRAENPLHRARFHRAERSDKIVRPHNRIARAKVKIGMANLIYNLERLIFLQRTAAA